MTNVSKRKMFWLVREDKWTRKKEQSTQHGDPFVFPALMTNAMLEPAVRPPHSPLHPCFPPNPTTPAIPMATPPLSPDSKAGAEQQEEEARELLYEAYNDLQALAAELGGAAGASPAVVVVGHQTDGKSALAEALMGFQFNHVGGGTKTRRPVALHLRFNPRCDAPRCRLLAGPGDEDEDEDDGVAGRPMPLADIQVRNVRSVMVSRV